MRSSSIVAAVLKKPGSEILALLFIVSTVVPISLWFSISYNSADAPELTGSLSKFLSSSRKQF